MSTRSIERGYSEGGLWPQRSPIDVPDVPLDILDFWDLAQALLPAEVKRAAALLGIYE